MAKRRNSRFQSGYGKGKGGVITCLECGKKTRDTGYGEGDHEMCKKCIIANELLNSLSDGEMTQEEYDEAIAELRGE